MPPSNLAELPTKPLESEPQSAIAFTEVFEAFGIEGYRCGYRGALHNLLASLVPLAEEHLRSAPAARANVYAFIEFLERRIERASSDAGYVADGLGI